MRKWSSISVYASRKIILIKTTDKDIAKTALLAKGFREAGQTVANAFRTFADKPEVDYSQKEQKHPITKAVLAPMKAVKKMLVLMEIHLDASIDKLDNLAMDVQLDKEKHMENAKAQKQTEPERAEAERFCVLFCSFIAIKNKDSMCKGRLWNS